MSFDRRDRLAGLSLALFLLVAMGTQARADGGFVTISENLGQVESDAQQALIIHDGERQTMVLRTEYRGVLADFAWIVPVPAQLTAGDVGEADDEVFEWLDERTAPTFVERIEIDVDRGCGCTDSLGSGTESDDLGRDTTDVLDTLATEAFDITVLTATTAEDLAAWLTDHGYALPPDGEAVLAHYLDAGWVFLAVQLRPDGSGSDVSLAPPPLRLSFDTDQPVFPLHISTLSSRSEAPLLLHLVAPHRQRPANADSALIGGFVHQCPFSAETYGEDYEACVLEASRVRDYAFLAVEYAGFLQAGDYETLDGHLGAAGLDPGADYVLTRLHGFFEPTVFSEDLWFEDEDHDGHYQPEIQIEDGHASSYARRWTGGASLGLALALGVLVWRRGPRGLALLVAAAPLLGCPGGGPGATVSSTDGWSQVAVGHDHACGLRDDGSAVCWGSEEYHPWTAPEGPFRDLGVGGSACGVRDDGTLACWGCSSSGMQYGGCSPPGADDYLQVEVGSDYACARKEDGHVICWGTLAIDEQYLGRMAPEGSFTDLSMANKTTCGVTAAGEALCWGCQGGTVDSLCTEQPGPYVAATAGQTAACALSDGGEIECWGDNAYELLQSPAGSFTAISLGGQHGCARAEDGHVECWGCANSRYEGEEAMVPCTPPGVSFTQIDATLSLYDSSEEGHCGVRDDGFIECWGRGSSGALSPP